MNANTQTTVEKNSRASGGIVAGIILIACGLVSLAVRFTSLQPTMYPLILGVIFLAAGLLTRKSGLLIPGGILTGLFAGVTLMFGPFAHLPEPANAGIFLAAFAGGWVLISLLSLYTEGLRKWWSWPLYPAVVIGLIATALLAGEPYLSGLQFLGYIWPAFLIAGGLYLVVKQRKA